MMNDTFDPLNLDASVSLNRTVIAGHPAISPESSGRQAWDLLSARALGEAIRGEAEALRLPPDGVEDPLPALDELLRSPYASVRAAASRLAEWFGRYLGYLLITLTTENGAQTPFRRHWTGIQDVRLGGGIMRGELGRAMCGTARKVLDAAGRADVALEVAPHAELLTVIGAARSVRAASDTALVYDFGGSFVKRAVARYGANALVGLQPLPLVPALALPARADPGDTVLARRIGDLMTALIADDLGDAARRGPTPSRDVVASIACYVRDGQPLDYDASYAALRHLSDNAARYLSGAISERAGTAVDLTLVHDGTAAAHTFAGQPHTAVIMLGTWLGVGFAPESDAGLLPLAPDFRVEGAS